jgi:hypothetical protein
MPIIKSFLNNLWLAMRLHDGKRTGCESKSENIKAFAISASYGLDRWVWAEEMTKVRRDDRKQFSGG